MKKQAKRTRINEARGKQPRKEAGNDLYAEVQQQVAVRAAEQEALRRIEITGGDETAIGCKPSGWPEYKIILSEKLRGLVINNITKADQSAKVLNTMGFKTGSGQLWTPRLINIAKFMLFDLMADRVWKKPPPK